MPLPIGHAVLGLTAHSLSNQNNSVFTRWKLTIFVTLLANLPDVDVLIGLLMYDNGSACHRGPTHSLVFAVLMGFICSNAWKICSEIPKVGFKICTMLILSHIVADWLFTTAPVSFFWPFEVNWSIGHTGWGDVFSSVFLKAFQDAGIVLGCALALSINSVGKGYINHLTSSIRNRKFFHA